MPFLTQFYFHATFTSMILADNPKKQKWFGALNYYLVSQSSTEEHTIIAGARKPKCWSQFCITGLSNSKQQTDGQAPFLCVTGKIFIIYFCGLMRVSEVMIITWSQDWWHTPVVPALQRVRKKGDLPVPDQSQLHSKLKISLGHTGRSCHKKQN